MPLVPMRILLDHAAENDYGLVALNVNNMEQIQAIMEAAQETDSPVQENIPTMHIFGTLCWQRWN